MGRPRGGPGAAVAVVCPGRKVVVPQADGSGTDTVQALWAEMRERLDIVTIVCSDRASAILQRRMRDVGADPDMRWIPCPVCYDGGIRRGRHGDDQGHVDGVSARL